MNDELIEKVAFATYPKDERGHYEKRGDWPQHIQKVRTTIAVYKQYITDNGMVIVPREPTEAMILAGDDETLSETGIWEAMIQAAQGDG